MKKGDEDGSPLPFLDLSEFHVLAPPGEIFRVLDPQTDKETAALQKLLGLAKLSKNFLKEVSRERGTKKGGLWLHGWLRPRAQTPNFDIVAVHLKLFGDAIQTTIECSVYLVPVDRFDELRQALKAETIKWGKEMENFQRGLAGRN